MENTNNRSNGLIEMDSKIQEANEEINDDLFNKAKEISFSEAEKMSCENCFEELIFLLKDKNHEYSIGIITILECLAFAIENGNLPKLPSKWFYLVDHRYYTDFYGNENISY